MLPSIITEAEGINQNSKEIKENHKTIKRYLDYHVVGITISTFENIIKGLNNYVEFGVAPFIIHFIGLNNSALKFKSKIINKIQYSIMVTKRKIYS